MDFEIDRCTKRCATTGQELRPGDTIYSALRVLGADVVRLDYSLSGWPGPDAGWLGWWKSRLPDGNSSKPQWAPHEVMFRLLEEKSADPTAQDICYVLGLLMIRRKLLRLETTERQEGTEILVLFDPKTEIEYRVRVAEPEPQRVQEIQNWISGLLGAGVRPSATETAEPSAPGDQA